MVKSNRSGRVAVITLTLVLALCFLLGAVHAEEGPRQASDELDTPTLALPTATPAPTVPIHIAERFAGSSITLEETLSPGANYDRYLVSYLSDGLKIYALMTIPSGDKPKQGWPVIVFNHGYIPPTQYSTIETYSGHVNALALHGYIVFKPDFRGFAHSEGSSARSRNQYVNDDLNAIQALKQFPEVDPQRIGMWGHSMGGYITLAVMLTTHDVKAGVIWAGTVRRFADSATLKNLSGPLQLQQSTSDSMVPYRNSLDLYNAMRTAGLPVELYSYQNDDHNLSTNGTLALIRSLYFFDRYVKNAGSTQAEATPTGQ